MEKEYWPVLRATAIAWEVQRAYSQRGQGKIPKILLKWPHAYPETAPEITLNLSLSGIPRIFLYALFFVGISFEPFTITGAIL